MIGFAYKPASFHGDDQIKMPDRSRVFTNPKERRKSASLLDGIWKELIKMEDEFNLSIVSEWIGRSGGVRTVRLYFCRPLVQRSVTNE